MCEIELVEHETQEKMLNAIKNTANGVVFFDFRGHNEGVVDVHQVRMLCYLISAAAHQVGITDSVIKTMFDKQYICPGRAIRRFDVVIPLNGLSDTIIKQIIIAVNDYNAFGCMSVNQYKR